MEILQQAVLKGDSPVGELIEEVEMALDELRESYRMAHMPERFPCYVVELDGDIRFYYDWERCRNCVHGVPARFKRVRNTEELEAFLAPHVQCAEQDIAVELQAVSDDTPPWE